MSEYTTIYLKARIIKANVDLYDKISEEIEMWHRCISDGQEVLDGFRYLRDKFEFIKEIIGDSDNAKRYELIYTKC